MDKFKNLLRLFLLMFKIGLFTFGGGYAMLVLLENEFITKRKWMTEEEFTDVVAIAESTPGPIAINASTYVGYKVGKVLGAMVSTIAVCLPSLIIIFLISIFFDQFLKLKLVAKAFQGIRVCVCLLIMFAGIKMLKKHKKNLFNLILFSLSFIAVILLSLFDVDFSSVYLILIGGVVGVIFYLVGISLRRFSKQDLQSANSDSITNSTAQTIKDEPSNDNSFSVECTQKMCNGPEKVRTNTPQADKEEKKL